jgi:hypothetical protein
VKNGRKLAFGLALAIVIIVVDWSILHKDWRPLLWHIRHGRHVEMNGYRFTVPLLYDEDHGALARTLTVFQFPGHFSNKTSAITVEFGGSRPVPRFDGDDFEKYDRTAYLGPIHGNCIEYVAKQRREVSINNMSFSYTVPTASTYVYCNFNESLSTSFSGTFNAKEDFYLFMGQAEVVRKN